MPFSIHINLYHTAVSRQLVHKCDQLLQKPQCHGHLTGLLHYSIKDFTTFTIYEDSIKNFVGLMLQLLGIFELFHHFAGKR